MELFIWKGKNINLLHEKAVFFDKTKLNILSCKIKQAIYCTI